MKVTAGSYLGTGLDNLSVPMNGTIDIFADVIIIKGSDFIGREPQFWIRPMGADQTKGVTGVFYTGGIKQVLANEMILGTNAAVNTGGELYVWIAFEDTGNGDMLFTSWTGNNVDDRIINFSTVPDIAFVLGNISDAIVWGNRLSPPEDADPTNLKSQTLPGTAFDNSIQDFDNCGIEVGSSSKVNATGTQYYAFVIKEVPGVCKVVSYTGTGALQSLDCDFEPVAAFVHNTRADSIRPMMMRLPDSVSTDSWRMDGFGGGLSANGITLTGTGFNVGSHHFVNEPDAYFTGFAVTNGDAGADPDQLDVALVTQISVEVVQTFEVTPNPPSETPENPCLSPELVNIALCPDLPSASRPLPKIRTGFTSVPGCRDALPSASHPVVVPCR